MTHKQKELYILLLISAFCLFVYAFQIKSYLLLEIFGEAKYVSAAFSSIFSFNDIFTPKLNGVPFFEAGPLYYLILEFSALIFRGFSVFSARFPSVFIAFSTIIAIYFLSRRIFNKQFALIASLSSLATLSFIIFSCVSSPSMIASCFITLSVLFGITPLFIGHEGHKKYYFFSFWIFLTLAVLTQGLYGMLFPLFVIIFIYTFFRKLSDFIKPNHFIQGFLVFIISTIIWLIFAFMNNGFDVLRAELMYITPKLLSLKAYKSFLCNFSLFIFVGFMPWFFAVLIMFYNSLKNLIKNKNTNNVCDNNEKTFLITMLFATLFSLILYLLYGVSDFARLIPAAIFSALFVSYYWYKTICLGENIKSVQNSSFLFYISLVIFAVIIVFAYFFVSPVLKIYIEDLVVPIISLTLLVAIPGIIAVVLNRNVLNYSLHIIMSIMLFWFSTISFYNYVNSFGTKDLISFSIKAKKDNSILITFDLNNKYVMSYYYNNSVIFNSFLPPEEFYDKFGDSKNIYIVLKLTDLAYFDQSFTYEIVGTGKHYCEITNIKLKSKADITEQENDNLWE
ncbi:MAG: glycosyltransferase family 39 protein [Candidatus Gastranaerophilaceae bacterium]